MQWVLGASINAFTAHGLVSVSPMPTIPVSVVMRTTALSWALLQASASTSGTSNTKHSTLVILTISPLFLRIIEHDQVVPTGKLSEPRALTGERA